MAGQIKVARSKGRVIVTVDGNLTHDDVVHLNAVLVDLIDNQGNLRLVVDLRDVDTTGSSPGNILIEAWRRLRRRGGELMLTGRLHPVDGAVRSPADTNVGSTNIADEGMPAVS